LTERSIEFRIVLRCMDDIEAAAAFAIAAAKRRGRDEVGADELLLGGLQAISQFGVTRLGDWAIDLEALGADWMTGPEKSSKLAYSEDAVSVFDRAARIARAEARGRMELTHLLAAFAAEDHGLMGELKHVHGITSATWRAAIGALNGGRETVKSEAPRAETGRDYLTPEEAAEALGIHVQTMRAYIRSGRVPAYRVAGERAIRIRRADLEKVLEPLVPEDAAAKKTTKGE
jgi:excisionase family DNA binding protein